MWNVHETWKKLDWTKRDHVLVTLLRFYKQDQSLIVLTWGFVSWCKHFLAEKRIWVKKPSGQLGESGETPRRKTGLGWNFWLLAYPDFSRVVFLSHCSHHCKSLLSPTTCESNDTHALITWHANDTHLYIDHAKQPRRCQAPLFVSGSPDQYSGFPPDHEGIINTQNKCSLLHQYPAQCDFQVSQESATTTNNLRTSVFILRNIAFYLLSLQQQQQQHSLACVLAEASVANSWKQLINLMDNLDEPANPLQNAGFIRCGRFVSLLCSTRRLGKPAAYPTGGQPGNLSSPFPPPKTVRYHSGLCSKERNPPFISHT